MSDVLADIPVPGQEKKDQTLLFYLPNYALSTAAQIVRMLKEHGIAHEDSSVSRYAADTCKVLLQVPAYCANAVRQAFAQPQFLLPYYGVSCALHTEKKGQEHLVLRFNDLNASLFLPEEQAAVLHPVLEQLAAAQFIRELKLQGGSICFCYSSPRIKAVLTDARKILELHAYNQVMQTGYFDDVAVGCTFQQGGQTQELSLVLTKGFRSMVVVCGTAAQWSAECARQLEEQINARSRPRQAPAGRWSQGQSRWPTLACGWRRRCAPGPKKQRRQCNAAGNAAVFPGTNLKKRRFCVEKTTWSLRFLSDFFGGGVRE